MASFFLPTGQVYGFFVDGVALTMNENDVLTINPAITSAAFLTWMATLPTTVPSQAGIVWNNGGIPCVSQ